MLLKCKEVEDKLINVKLLVYPKHSGRKKDCAIDMEVARMSM